MPDRLQADPARADILVRTVEALAANGIRAVILPPPPPRSAPPS